ncbi:MAG TPA: UDP-N-acetylglucosamine 2-epimerase (non-hydrolyzing) [Syntrophorhabdaceae bacterium]|nr:UDP-N-acetylglucosamine 2-epimerase (non-hydrolyzing) [Syntrophorhabdaceae bacterium]
MKKILTVFGTRPEAIKLAPILLELKKYPEIDSRICVTAQHREMLDQVLELFGIKPDIDLDLMKPNQSLGEVTAGVVREMETVLDEEKPDIVLIQGDTTTVMATALAAFYKRVKIGHVEAGLRSGDIYSPYPEEMNRRMVSMVAALHFAPTRKAFDILISEGISSQNIFLTGNPVIDALKMIVNRPEPEDAKALLSKTGLDGNSNNRRLILVTAHRRENFGERFESICRGLRKIVEKNKEVVMVYPVHLNPNVQRPVKAILGGMERVFLTKPVTYDVLAHLMKKSYMVMTDSGGIQEEAPALGKPVLVMREETERPEGIEAGTARLVGTDEKKIFEEAERLLHDSKAYDAMAKATNPYGDGHAAERIVKVLREVEV